MDCSENGKTLPLELKTFGEHLSIKTGSVNNNNHKTITTTTRTKKKKKK